MIIFEINKNLLKHTTQHTTHQESLIRRLQTKDDACIKDIYDHYGGAMYGVILKIVHRETIAEDILQEAFMKIWKNGNQYDKSRGSFFTWIINIARNLAIDYIRSADYKNEMKKKDDVSKADNPVSSNFDENVGVKEMVFKLDPKFQEIIDLLYFKGYSHAEAADSLGLPLGTVKTRARMALKELKETVI